MRSAAVRQRNAILETLELFRDIYPGISIGHMIALLYTCENEGLTILDLSQVTGFYVATASRAIRAFLESGAEGVLPPGLGLIEIRPSPRGKALYLTEAGRRLRDDLEAIIGEASPITGPAEQAA
jgi:DNA-binding MarR family transcriptional regulator